MTEKPNTEIEPFLCSKIQDGRGIAAVIFDWDDTILDSFGYYQQLHDTVVRRMRKEGFKPAQPNDAFVIQDRHVIPSFHGFYDDWGTVQHATKLRNELYETTRHEIKPYNDALQTLHFLKEHDIPFAIASNTPQEIVQEQFRHIFGKEFPGTVVVGAGGPNHHPKKPDPAMIETALKALGHPEASNKAVYFVGDTHNTDIDAAVKLGLSPVLFSNLDADILMERTNHDLPSTPDSHRHYDALLPRMVDYIENHTELQTLFAKKIRQYEQAQESAGKAA